MFKSKLSGNDGIEGGMGGGSLGSSLRGETVTISATSFAVTALMFESVPASILSTSYSKPVYVHHVVLCPLNLATITNVCTSRYSLFPHCIKIGKYPSGQRCFLSVTSVPCLKMERFLSEVKYRKSYGVMGHLTFQMLQRKHLKGPTSFKLLYQKKYSTWLPLTIPKFVFVLPSQAQAEDPRMIVTEATKAYESLVMDAIATMIQYHEPIIID